MEAETAAATARETDAPAAEQAALNRKADGPFVQGYNGQLAVDHNHRVTVAAGVSNQPTDSKHLEPMPERIATMTGAPPAVMTDGCGLLD